MVASGTGISMSGQGTWPVCHAVSPGNSLSVMAAQGRDIMDPLAALPVFPTRSVLECFPEPVCVLDPAYRVSYINPAAERLTGWSQAQVAGRACEEVFGAGLRPVVERCAAEAGRQGGGVVPRRKAGVVTSTGGITQVVVAASFLGDPAAPDGSLVVLSGLDGLEEADPPNLRAASLRGLSPIPVIELDRLGRVVYANASAERLLPGVLAEGSGHPFLEGLEAVVEGLDEEARRAHLREVHVGDVRYQQFWWLVPQTHRVRVYAIDITEKQVLDAELGLTVAILESLNKPLETLDAMSTILGHVKAFAGVDAVGLRLRQGDDFPYYETRGFPAEFVRLESSLCPRGGAAGLRRDGSGAPQLECMCGNVITGRTDPSQPFFTAGGSFWCNSTTDLLATTTPEQRQSETRDRCHGFGYESVALVPLRSGSETIGLIQLNDRRPGKLSLELVEFLERLGNSIGIALARRRVEQASRESESLYRTLFESAADAVVVLDSRAFVDCNAAALRLFGCGGREELVGRHPSELSPPTQTDGRESRAAADERIAMALRDGSCRFEWLHQRADASTFPADVLLSRVELGTGPALMAVVRDVTERKRTEKAQRLAVIGQLAAGVTHDLGNLLGAMRAWGQLAMQGDCDHSKELVDVVMRATAQGTTIIQDLMAFARREEPATEVMRLEGAAEAALAVEDRQLAASGIEVVRRYQAEGWPVVADQAQMERVFMNLIVNACHAMPGGGTLTIESKYVPHGGGGGEVVVSVSDTGTGIGREHLPHIFEPFFTTKRHLGEGGISGSGLGLSVSHGIIEANGGRIAARSEVGVGTTLEVALPAYTGEGPLLAPGDARAFVAPAAPPERKGRILVAEDARDLSSLVATILTARGHQVQCAHTTEDATRALGTRQYDLVITDLLMPGGGGRAVLEQARALEEPPPVLVITGVMDVQLEEEVRALGAGAVVHKPFSRAELSRRVKELLEG